MHEESEFKEEFLLDEPDEAELPDEEEEVEDEEEIPAVVEEEEEM